MLLGSASEGHRPCRVADREFATYRLPVCPMVPSDGSGNRVRTPTWGVVMTNLLRRLASRLVDRLDAAITHRADARARAMGLTIERIPGTRIHLYSRGGRGFSARPAALSTTKGGEHR